MAKPITQADARHVAKLGRLKLTDAEVEHFTEQLAHVLAYIDQLGELNLDGVEPMAHPTDLTNALRDDVVSGTLSVEEALGNAPDAEPPFFRVPKVLGDGGA